MNQNVRQEIRSSIESQFPSIYRENAPLFIEFVETYYEWLYNQEYNVRELLHYIDVDSTKSMFLDFFRETYLKDLPTSSVLDYRFITKHIQDLYRRKGTEESLRLFFKMFTGEEIEVIYPGKKILKASDSLFVKPYYLELRPVSKSEDVLIKPGNRIKGSVSKATAFVESIVIYNIKNKLIPLAYLSNLKGNFVNADSVILVGDTETSLGRIIKGSITSIQVNLQNRKPNVKVGDTLNVVSTSGGKNSKCVVDRVSEESTGLINFTLLDGGYGYTPNAEVVHSNQTLLISNSESEFSFLDTIEGSNGEFLTVVAYEAPLLFLKASNASLAFSETNSTFFANNTTKGATFEVSSASPFNSSAFFDISKVSEDETVTVITDIIADYISTVIPANNIVISEYFNVTNLTIGKIEEIFVRFTGVDYRTNVKTVIHQPEITVFDRKDVILSFSDNSFFLAPGDIITQSYPSNNVFGTSNTDIEVRGEFLKRIPNTNKYIFKYKSFYPFDNEFSVNIKGNSFNIKSIEEDESSLPSGLNAIVTGDLILEKGQILSVYIIDTGINYEDGEIVNLVDSSNTVLATGTLTVDGTGFSESGWKTKSSFIGEQVIQDNDYYQEYSFELSSEANQDEYSKLVREHLQVAGTKLFNSFFINNKSNLEQSTDCSVVVEDIETGRIIVLDSENAVGFIGYSANSILEGSLLSIGGKGNIV